jgi:hypothetical protein
VPCVQNVLATTDLSHWPRRKCLVFFAPGLHASVCLTKVHLSTLLGVLRPRLSLGDRRVLTVFLIKTWMVLMLYLPSSLLILLEAVCCWKGSNKGKAQQSSDSAH